MYIYTYKCATCNTPILYTIFGEQTARGLSQHFPHFAFDRWHHWRLHFHLWLSFLSGFYWIFKTTTSFEVVPGFANLLQMINSLSLECFRYLCPFGIFGTEHFFIIFVTACQRSFQHISLTWPKSPWPTALLFTSRWDSAWFLFWIQTYDGKHFGETKVGQNFSRNIGPLYF